MSADEHARETARRLVLEVLSAAGELQGAAGEPGRKDAAASVAGDSPQSPTTPEPEQQGTGRPLIRSRTQVPDDLDAQTWPTAGVNLLPAGSSAPQTPRSATGPVSPFRPIDAPSVQRPVRVPEDVTATKRLTVLDRWHARRHRRRLAAQWAPGSTPQPRRTWRWLVVIVVTVTVIAVLFPLAVAAVRELFAL